MGSDRESKLPSGDGPTPPAAASSALKRNPDSDSIQAVIAAPPSSPSSSPPSIAARDRRERILDGPIRPVVFALALPILGEQVLNAAIAWNDVLIAGRISAVATGAVGFASYVSWLMTMMFGLVSIGATAIVARAVGAGDRREADHATNQSFILSVLIGLTGMAAISVAAPGFAALLNMRGEAARVAVAYLRIDALGYLGASMSFALAACLRGAGDTRTPLYILGGVNVMNLVLSWLLAFGIGPWDGIGVNGVAWGTALARWLGCLGFIAVMQRPSTALHLRRSEMRPNRAMYFRILRVGVPAAVDGAMSFSGHFVFMTIVSRVPSIFSTEIVYAAHIIGIRAESISYLPAQAYMLAAATLVGQNLGANQPDRARRSANEALRQTAVMLVGSGLLLYFGAELIYRLLSNDPRVGSCGVPAMRTLAFFQLSLAPLIVYTGALRGAGDTRVPIAITVAGLALVRVPVAAYGGFVLKWGLLGAWLGMFADLCVRALLIAWRFRSGRWQRINV